MVISTGIIIVCLFLLLYLFYLEIRGRIQQKKCTEKLSDVMQYWCDNHDLTKSEKEYLKCAISVAYNPLYIIRLMVLVWKLPFIKISPPKPAKSLRKKNTELFDNTMQILQQAFICTSPSLYLIVMLELTILRILLLFVRIILLFLIPFFVVAYIIRNKPPLDTRKVETMGDIKDDITNIQKILPQPFCSSVKFTLK